MNDIFYQLPLEKQQSIINAGYRVFSQNSYQKSPMLEIAQAAGISKSLLFYYFRNKADLYLFLWTHAVDMTIDALQESGCYETDDLFLMIQRGAEAKFRLMKEYPYLALFVLRAYTEKNPEIHDAIHASYDFYYQEYAIKPMHKADRSRLWKHLDLDLALEQMTLAIEGYVYRWFGKEPLDFAKMERDFQKMLRFWKSIYQRKES